MITSFADLLHPHDPDLLLAAARDGRRLLLRTDRAGQFGKLMSWERFNDLITPDKVVSGDVEFARSNAILPAEMTIERPKRQKPPIRMRTAALKQYARQGISTVINAVERMDPDTRRLAAILERAFHAPVQVNLYASFGKGSAFKPHWDGHNVLVLQLHGRKLWHSWGQPWQAPRSHALCTVPDQLGEPEFEVLLEPGDLLYLPRGEVHAASLSSDADSMHLTLGIAPPGFEALTAALAAACQSEGLARQDLPILADEHRKSEWMNDARQLLHRAVDALDLDGLLGMLDSQVEPLPAGFFGVDHRIHAGTLVLPTLRRRLHTQISPNGGGEIHAGSQNWTVDGIECEILRLITGPHRRSVADLAEALGDGERRSTTDVVARLAHKGLVTLHN